jgi:hypothetical protein
MDPYLIFNAARHVQKAYYRPTHEVLSTQWHQGAFIYNDQFVQCIAIAGSNQPTDWLWNVCMASWDGVKLASYFSAKRILKKYERVTNLPLMVCGHSKAGATAVYLAQLLNADYCISFNPAPGFRTRRKVKNTLLVLDPNDIVHHLGKINFKQPDCEIYELPDDKKGYDLKDHKIENSIQHFSQVIHNGTNMVK